MYVGGGWWWWCLQKPSKEKFRSIAEIEHVVGVVDVSWGWKSSMTGRQTDRQRDSEWHPIKWDFVILISFWGRNQSWQRDKVWRWQTMVRIDRISSLSDKRGQSIVIRGDEYYSTHFISGGEEDENRNWDFSTLQGITANLLINSMRKQYDKDCWRKEGDGPLIIINIKMYIDQSGLQREGGPCAHRRAA